MSWNGVVNWCMNFFNFLEDAIYSDAIYLKMLSTQMLFEIFIYLKMLFKDVIDSDAIWNFCINFELDDLLRSVVFWKLYEFIWNILYKLVQKCNISKWKLFSQKFLKYFRTTKSITKWCWIMNNGSFTFKQYKTHNICFWFKMK